MNYSVTSVFAAALVAVFPAGAGRAHDGHGLPDLPGATHYALIDDFHTVPSTTDATGEIFLRLNHERTELHYKIVLDGTLGLKPNPADRTQPDDIIGIHMHEHVPGLPMGVGPHVLNIFGLATYGMPAEEDADLIIDYEHQTLTGIYDISDATIDPETGQPYHQFFPLTSKIIDEWLDELENGLMMVGIHTNESGFPTMALHGHIARVVPEPAGSVVLVIGYGAMWSRSRKRRAAKC
jgi:hypothetical protein